MNIYSVEEIKKIEENAINNIGIPEIILMENAAFSVCSAIFHKKDKAKKIAIICGFGNNGGDGFACGRKLISYGYDTTIFYVNNLSKFSQSTLTNFNILKNSNANLVELVSPYNFDDYDVIIDALFGSGLKRQLSDEYKNIIDCVNNTPSYKIAIDVPSGIIADSNKVEGSVFKADTTISLIGMKLCHVLYPAKSYCGKVVVNNITIDTSKNISDITYATINNLPKLKKREKDTHKGNYGHSLIIGGSSNMVGAVYISALSSLRVGSGLVSALIPTNSIPYFANTPEIMVTNLESGDYFRENDVKDVLSIIDSKNISVMCIGNGLGRNSQSNLFVKEIIKNTTIPLIIDADGLYAIDNDYKFSDNRCIVTPHLKEFATMIDKSVDEVKNNAIYLSLNYAKIHNVIVVLKSANTIIAYPSGKVVIADFGSASLAKGGSGDAFAGIITGLISQKYNINDAVVIACYILGKSSKICQSKYGEDSVIITDVINAFGDAINEIKEDSQ